ncbi:MAG: pyridoxal-phosphate dependent enzyme, partial [Candidatus Methylomirabilales bacterium]
ICSAVAAGDPLDGLKALSAIRESGGCALTASDGEILEAQQRLARLESIFVEPAGAIPIAVLHPLLTTARVHPDEVVVCLATGNGLKDPRSALRVLPSPAAIEPSIQEVDKFLKLRLYEIRAAGAKNGDRNLFNEVPSKAALSELVKKEFGIRLTLEYAQRVLSLVEDFVNKGKPVTKADLQYILETTLRGSFGEGVLKVEDFQVTTTLHGQAQARVWVSLEGERVESSAAGVGPVDAVINALKAAASSRGRLLFELIDYQVEINSPGADASVETTLVLKDAQGNRIVATGTSPDIIVASVQAFVGGYNLLWSRQHS